MASSKLSPRRATARKPPVCYPPPPPPPPPPWPPRSIHYLGHLQIDAASGPYWWHPQADIPRDPHSPHYATVISDGYSSWDIDLVINTDTRHITGVGYGTNSDSDFFGCDWDGPDLPDPWASAQLLLTTNPYGLISAKSYVSPNP